MKSAHAIAIPTKYNILLGLIALISFICILLSTHRYGAGIAPDPVRYISTARNIATGMGVTSYDDTPFVTHPPVYPALLALVSLFTGADPLVFAHILNALIFGLIVYLGGRLIFRYLSSFPTLALLGTLAIACSRPLFAISGWAFSEPLFICFVLLSLLFSHSYLAKNDIPSLLLLSLSVTLATLTRYPGVTLMLWGALIILIYHPGHILKKIQHLAVFSLLTALPLVLWLTRSYLLTGTLAGPRRPSALTFLENLSSVFTTSLYWYMPRAITEQHLLFIVISAGFCLFVGFSLKQNWQGIKVRLQQLTPVILFIITYIAFLVISSTIVGYDHIRDRLLSPIYVPLTLVLLILADTLVDSHRRRFSKSLVNSLLAVGMAIWLLYPISSSAIKAATLNSNGRGFTSKAWIESETVKYLNDHQTLISKCTFYTNGTDVAYLLAHLPSKTSPIATEYYSSVTVNTMSSLKGTWPKENNACLIWFDKINRNYLFTVDQLQQIANIEPIALLEDGAVYTVSRK